MADRIARHLEHQREIREVLYSERGGTDDFERMLSLIEKDISAFTSFRDVSGRNALHTAVINIQYSKVAAIMNTEAGSLLRTLRDKYGFTPADYATLFEDYQIITSLRGCASPEGLRLRLETCLRCVPHMKMDNEGLSRLWVTTLLLEFRGSQTGPDSAYSALLRLFDQIMETPGLDRSNTESAVRHLHEVALQKNFYEKLWELLSTSRVSTPRVAFILDVTDTFWTTTPKFSWESILQVLYEVRFELRVQHAAHDSVPGGGNSRLTEEQKTRVLTCYKGLLKAVFPYLRSGGDGDTILALLENSRCFMLEAMIACSVGQSMIDREEIRECIVEETFQESPDGITTEDLAILVTIPACYLWDLIAVEVEREFLDYNRQGLAAPCMLYRRFLCLRGDTQEEVEEEAGMSMPPQKKSEASDVA